MDQKEVLDILEHETHSFFTDEFVAQVNEAFDTKLKPSIHYADLRNPKGLTLNSGATQASGLSALEIALRLCDHFHVRYDPKMGRGFQVRTCVAALRTAGFGEVGAKRKSSKIKVVK